MYHTVLGPKGRVVYGEGFPTAGLQEEHAAYGIAWRIWGTSLWPFDKHPQILLFWMIS